MPAFDYGQNQTQQSPTQTGMSSTGMSSGQSSFDSSGMNYGSSNPTRFDVGAHRSWGTPQRNFSGQTQTDGTLLGTQQGQNQQPNPQNPQMNVPIGTDPQFAGMDPRLAALYQKSGMTPSGSGTGFADWKYWQNDALKNAGGDWNYILDRLGNDLNGTGTDQPTGTPGQGIWSNSGRNQQGQQSNPNDMMGFFSQLMSMLFGGQNQGSKLPNQQQGQPIRQESNYSMMNRNHVNDQSRLNSLLTPNAQQNSAPLPSVVNQPSSSFLDPTKFGGTPQAGFQY